MPWPSPQDYNEAIQNSQHAFADPELQRGQPEIGPLGLPRPIAGANASVYRMQCGQNAWAVKCFLHDRSDQRPRYAAMSEHLGRVRLPYTIGFTFLPQGISVGRQWYPILKMEWVQGIPLNDYVKRHLGNSDVLHRLADQWIQMIKTLQQASVAHGDLQHGNVFVVGEELRLVDYDGMYVPSLSGKTSHEIGHRNYQHPHRTERDFGPHLDTFSAWVIYVSLIVPAIDSSLWHRFGAGDECLLFRRDDFASPESSEVLLTLERHSDRRLQQLAVLLASYVHMPMSKIPALDGIDIPNDKVAEARTQGKAEWLRDYVTFDESLNSVSEDNRSDLSSDDSWIYDHIQGAEVSSVAFDVVPLPDRVGLICLLGCVLLVGYGIFFGPITSVAGGVLGTVIAGMLICRYRAQSTVEMNLRLHKQIKSLEKQILTLEHVLKTLMRERKNIDDSEKSKLLDINKVKSKLSTEESQKIRDADESLKREVTQLNSRSRFLKQEETEAIRRVGVQLQDKIGDIPRQQVALDEAKSLDLSRLQNMLELRRVNIQGIGPKLMSRLLKAGIAKASDVTRSRVSAIEGFGDMKTAAVLEWQKKMEAQVQSQETSIRAKYSAQRHTLDAREVEARRQAQIEEEGIRRRYKPMLDVLDSEELKVKRDTGSMIDGIRKQYQARHASLEYDKERMTNHAELRRKAIDTKIEEERKSVAKLQSELKKLQRRYSEYKQATFGAYLRRAFRP